uniref:Uncharacterized protein n=1 Tax=Arundo donax TaxID=35708 RepID=A0A0A9CCE3_ARUDO
MTNLTVFLACSSQCVGSNHVR